jgi:tetratricopeptide (TPR) repeat protein
MKKKDNLLLKEVMYYRNNFMFPEALATMHQVVAQNPETDIFLYLLASLYYEVKEEDLSLSYCEKALDLNNSCKEALELRAVIHLNNQEYKDAKDKFQQALRVDPDFYQVRMQIISLLYNHFQEYENVVNHSEYFKANFGKYTQNRKKDALRIFLTVYLYHFSALIKLESYEKAYSFLKYSIEFMRSKVEYFQGFFFKEEIDIFKLCKILQKTEDINYWKKYLVENYDFDNDSFLEIEQEVKQCFFNTTIK